MKYFFLWAVAISALCSSCETADESFLEENNTNSSNQTLQTQQRTVSDYDVYNNVVSSFVYDTLQLHYENQLEFEQHVNNLVHNGSTYEAINFTQLEVLISADINYIEQLNYSTEAKAAITAILNQTFDTDSLKLINSTEEYRLITTLYDIHGNGNGNDDDNWNDRKIIAFAYGAQYNLTNAILYAGVIDLIKYID